MMRQTEKEGDIHGRDTGSLPAQHFATSTLKVWITLRPHIHSNVSIKYKLGYQKRRESAGILASPWPE
jgi:hypothetical protein